MMLGHARISVLATGCCHGLALACFAASVNPSMQPHGFGGSCLIISAPGFRHCCLLQDKYCAHSARPLLAAPLSAHPRPPKLACKHGATSAALPQYTHSALHHGAS